MLNPWNDFELLLVLEAGLQSELLLFATSFDPHPLPHLPSPPLPILKH